MIATNGTHVAATDSMDIMAVALRLSELARLKAEIDSELNELRPIWQSFGEQVWPAREATCSVNPYHVDNFAKKLRRWRKERGFTQHGLACLMRKEVGCGIQSTRISSIECGQPAYHNGFNPGEMDWLRKQDGWMAIERMEIRGT